MLDLVLKDTATENLTPPSPSVDCYVPSSLLSERVSLLSLNLFDIPGKEGVLHRRSRNRKLSNKKRGTNLLFFPLILRLIVAFVMFYRVDKDIPVLD